jgi:hypothetical protein
MSDTEFGTGAVPEGTAVDKAATHEMLTAFYSGNREKADAMNDAIMGGDGDGDGAPESSEGDAPPVLPAETFHAVRAEIDALPHGNAIYAVIGPPHSPDFDQNVRDLVEFRRVYGAEFHSLIHSDVTLPNGATIKLGDHPDALRFALEKMQNRRERNIGNNAMSNRSTPYAPAADGGAQAQMAALIRERNTAMARGDRDEAKAIDRQIQAVAERAYGGQPIVGKGGRTA